LDRKRGAFHPSRTTLPRPARKTMIKKWKLLSSIIDRDYRVFKVRIEEAVSPRTAGVGQFYTIESNHWVNVVAVTPDQQVVMIRQYRHGSRGITLEIPGGLVEEDDPGDAAERELLEETGFSGKSRKLIGSTNPNPAIFSNLCYTYLVLDAVKTSPLSLDDNEDIDVELVPLASIPGLIADGTIDHALVIVAFHFYFHHNGLYRLS
jgi:ADP-ribose pyrophosphatase